MRNKSFLSSIFHPFVCRTNRTGYLQFIQFFNCSFPAGDAPLGKTSKSPLHFADYRGESVISSYYISAPRPQARSVRVELGKKFEEGFYAKQKSPSPQAVPAAGEPTISMTALLELLKNADPEVKAQLRLALLT